MRLWSRLTEFFRLPEPYEHLDGWAFDGEQVFVDTFCQSKGPRADDIPPAGSGWWWSYVARKQFHQKHIFESQREAVEYALAHIDKRIASLQATREKVVQDWRGHLHPVD